MKDFWRARLSGRDPQIDTLKDFSPVNHKFPWVRIHISEG